MGALSNTKWVGLGQGGKIIIQLISMVLLARLIPPNQFGVMSMALVVTNFALLIRDLGTSSAIIQKKDLTNDVINVVFWLNMSMGCVVCLVIMLGAPYASYFFQQDSLMYVLLMLAIGFPIASSSSVHLALLERESAFKTVARIEIFSSSLGLTLAIISAYCGFGVYSLVVQSLTTSFVSSLQLWISSKWRPRFWLGIKKDDVHSLLYFSGHLTLFNFINYFSRNADSIIIGKFFSASVLGAYSLAYRVMLFPLQSITVVANRALFPIMSKAQDKPAEIKQLYLNTVFFIAIIVAPLMGGLLALRIPFVSIVFGPNWSYVADILFWLAPTGFIQAIVSTTGSVFMAKGQAKVLMLFGLLGAFLQIGAFIIGAQYDVIMLAKLYFIANLINSFPVMLFLMRLLHGSVMDIIRLIVPALISTFSMVVFLNFVNNNIYHFSEKPTLFELLFSSFLGGIMYIVILSVLSFRKLKVLRKHKGH